MQFIFDKKVSDTIKMTDKAKAKINNAKGIMKKIKIPETFENRKKIGESIELLNTTMSGIKSANTALDKLINKINITFDIINKKSINVTRKLFNIEANEKETKNTKKFGIPGYTYEQLDAMGWNEFKAILSKYCLNSPYLGTIDADAEEYNTILTFIYDKGNYVPQGSTYLDNNKRYISVCYLKEQTEEEKKAGKEEEGFMVVIDTETKKKMWEEPFKGHANDITCVIEDSLLIIPNRTKSQDGETEEVDWNVYNYNIDGENINMELEYTLKDMNDDGFDYDETRKEFTILEGPYGYVYDKDVILNPDLSSDERNEKRAFFVADLVEDFENNEYYTTRGGTVVEDGKMILVFAGFDVPDKDEFENPDSNVIGNLYVLVDTDTGEVLGHYKDNVTQESEGVNYLKNGDTSVTMNYGTEVRVYSSKESQYNKEYIAQNYYKNEQTIKTKKKPEKNLTK